MMNRWLSTSCTGPTKTDRWGCLRILLGSMALASAANAQEIIECGFTLPDTETPFVDCAEDSSSYVVKALFVTFPDVLDAINEEEQLLPQYADSMVNDLEGYIAALSYGDAMIEFSIERRAGADSSYYWVAPAPSDSISNPEEMMLNLPPDGWDEGVDLFVFLQTKPTAQQDNTPITSGGTICLSGFHRIRMFTGVDGGGGWAPHSRALVEAILVHEVGHAFGAGHLPWGPVGNNTGCTGGYYHCFSMMQSFTPSSCSDNFEPRFNGLIAYDPVTLTRIGFLHPDTIDYTVDDVEIGDVRSYKNAAVYVPIDPVSGSEHEGFLITNHQMSKYDEALNERGLAIWHVVREPAADPFECFTADTGFLLDLEHPNGKWAPIDPSEPDEDAAYCRDLPLPTEDASAGVDTLDCTPSGGGAVGALWSGVALSPSTYRSFDAHTNPNTNRYPYVPIQKYRITPQVDTTGVAIRNIQSIADIMMIGKYKIRFDVQVDYP